jgi:putative addiction module component (TIGR02574 family)
MQTTDFDFSKLSIAERIQLAEDLWDSVVAESTDIPLTDAQRAELDRRLEDLRRNPDDGAPWDEVRERISDRLSQGE